MLFSTTLLRTFVVLNAKFMAGISDGTYVVTRFDTRKLRVLRRCRGMSMREVSRGSGVDLRALSFIERGMGNPTRETLERICGVLGLEIHFVIR